MNDSPRFPDFLVIGAMKAGTTTLYHDLRSHPGIFLPEEKEPEDLASDDVLTDPGRQAYAHLFSFARDHQIVGEASTAYTKLPDVDGVPKRALALCGPGLKLIYIVRDPVQRMLSHYKHEYAMGIMQEHFDTAVERHPCLADYSRFAMQLKPWIDTFGQDNILLLRFEDYIAARHQTLHSVYDFLGVSRTVVTSSMAAHNVSDDKVVARGPLSSRIVGSRFFQRRVKPLVPWRLRALIARIFLPRAAVPNIPALDVEMHERLSKMFSRADWEIANGELRRE